MDTTTVLEIIKMIDNRLLRIRFNLSLSWCENKSEELAVQASLTELKDHLQSFIENEVNKIEP